MLRAFAGIKLFFYFYLLLLISWKSLCFLQPSIFSEIHPPGPPFSQHCGFEKAFSSLPFSSLYLKDRHHLSMVSYKWWVVILNNFSFIYFLSKHIFLLFVIYLYLSSFTINLHIIHFTPCKRLGIYTHLSDK